MKVKVKPTAGGGAAALLEVELEGGEATTVADAKRAIAALMPEMGPDPRLIYRGQILKDERTVGSYGIDEDHVIHMVRSKPASAGTTSATGAAGAAAPSSASPAAAAAPAAPANATAAPSLGLFNPTMDPTTTSPAAAAAGVRMLLDLPPETLRSVVESMPGMRQLFERSPEARALLSDPQALRDGLRLMSSPALMREAMRSSDRSLQHIESLPGGFNALRSLYETVQAPLMEAAAEAGAASASGGGGESSGGGGAAGAAAGSSPPSALPNPWAPASGGGALGSSGGGAAAAADPGAAALAAMLSGAGGGGGGLPGGVSPSDFQNLLFGQGLGGSSGGGGGANNPSLQPNNVGAMADLLEQNPALSEAAAQMMANPSVVEAILQSSPQLREAADRTPELRRLLASPQLVRALMTPQALRQSAALQSMLLRGEPGSAFASGAAAGGGDLASMMAAMMGGGAGGAAGGQAGGGTGAAGQPPGLPNLDALAPMLAALGMGGGGAAGGAGLGGLFGAPPPAPPPVADPETHYASQLSQLRDMGFYDAQENIAALQATGGNVSAAVERLLGGGGA